MDVVEGAGRGRQPWRRRTSRPTLMLRFLIGCAGEGCGLLQIPAPPFGSHYIAKAMEFAGGANVRKRKGRVALFPHSHHRSRAHITNLPQKFREEKRKTNQLRESRRDGEDRRLHRRR